MARPLWGSEIETLAGKPVGLAEGLELIRETFALDDLRQGVVAAPRRRVPNKWEQAFWSRFDAEEMGPDRAD